MLSLLRSPVGERRREPRVAWLHIEPPGVTIVDFEGPQRTLAHTHVLNVSRTGAALSTPDWVEPGVRLAFSVGGNRAPVLCEVLACEKEPDGRHRVRCRCVLGGFDV